MEWSVGSFGDLRLDISGGAILQQMVALETVCLKRLGGDRRGEERAGRFFGSDKVTTAKIVESWSQSTAAAVQGRHVLAVQDTCEVGFPTRAERRRGLGLIGNGHSYGVLVHSMIAVDADSGACLGLVGGAVWNRTVLVTIPHNDRPLSERESRRWLDTAEQESAARAMRAIARWRKRCGCAWSRCARSRHPTGSNRCTGGC